MQSRPVIYSAAGLVAGVPCQLGIEQSAHFSPRRTRVRMVDSIVRLDPSALWVTAAVWLDMCCSESWCDRADELPEARVLE